MDLSNLDPAFDGVLRPARDGGTRCEYFQDRNKRWPFHCDADGYRLLARLLRVATPVVGAVQTKIDAACAFDPTAPDSDAVVAEGQRIYARKPNMGEHDVTWSQAEYGHLGLQSGAGEGGTSATRACSASPRRGPASGAPSRRGARPIFARLTESRDAPGVARFPGCVGARVARR